MSFQRMLWKLDARKIRVAWAYDSKGVVCYPLDRDHIRARGKTGAEALAALLRRLP